MKAGTCSVELPKNSAPGALSGLTSSHPSSVSAYSLLPLLVLLKLLMLLFDFRNMLSLFLIPPPSLLRLASATFIRSGNGDLDGLAGVSGNGRGVGYSHAGSGLEMAALNSSRACFSRRRLMRNRSSRAAFCLRFEAEGGRDAALPFVGDELLEESRDPRLNSLFLPFWFLGVTGASGG